MSCSLLIASNKDEVLTLKDPKMQKYASEILINNTLGVSASRNQLAKEARNEVLVFMDDDIKVLQTVWDSLRKVKPDEIFMVEGYNHPITRIMALHKKTFYDIGGFDENIKYNGEDLDFYWRALEKGYIISIIPQCLVQHKPHRKANWLKYHFESGYARIKHGKTNLHFFVQANPIVFILRLTGYLYYKYRETRK